MTNSEVLGLLDLGSSVAENDPNLVNYFVPTVALQSFLQDRFDIIRGVKGSGKSAILRVVSSHQASYPILNDVLLNVATEHAGEPAFKRAFDTLRAGEYTEGALINAWKTYLINLVLDAVEQLPDSPEVSAAIQFAEKTGLRYKTTSSFKKMWWSLLRTLHIRSFTIGLESVAAEFPDTPPDIWTRQEEIIDFPGALQLSARALSAHGKRCWLLIDRLDAAFQDQPELERVALRSLIVAHKDFMGYPEVRAKLFLRTDLFDQISAGVGFRELTHVLDRTSPPIIWDSDKLLQMVMERFAYNEPVREKYGFGRGDIEDPEIRQVLFFSIFPAQIDVGPRKADTWNWMLSRIRDGAGTRTPRDLHALVLNSARKQLDLLALGGNNHSDELITSQAVKAGLGQLSSDKITTTLIAENPGLEPSIRAFAKQKAEQNADTLPELLGAEWRTQVDGLVRIGFLEQIGDSWKVPMLYRDGLEITQGAAFAKPVADDRGTEGLVS